jgi:hypothetical protein
MFTGGNGGGHGNLLTYISGPNCAIFTGGEGGGQSGLLTYLSGPNCQIFTGGNGGGNSGLLTYMSGPNCAIYTGGEGGGQSGLLTYISGPNCQIFTGGIGGGNSGILSYTAGPNCSIFAGGEGGGQSGLLAFIDAPNCHIFAGGNGGGNSGLVTYLSGPNCAIFTGGDGGGQSGLLVWQAGPFCAPKITTKIFLQAAYNSVTGLMNTTLNSQRVIPVLQPYNTTTFNHYGKEKVDSAFFSTHPDIVDWVLLELRDSLNPAIVVVQHAAFVNKDGNVVDTNGLAPVAVTGIKAGGNYYLTIQHRNHLTIRTEYPRQISAGAPMIHDFTTDQLQAYNSSAITSNAAMSNLGGGKFGMWMGNVTQDNMVRSAGSPSINDVQKLLTYLTAGDLIKKYHPADINMDGSARKSGPNSLNDYQKLMSFLTSLGVTSISAHL